MENATSKLTCPQLGKEAWGGVDEGKRMGLDETKANKEDPNVASVPRPFRPSASGRNKFQSNPIQPVTAQVMWAP